MLSPQELDSIAAGIISRYQAHYSIQLTLHQARMVFRFEEENTIFMIDNFPSDREKYEYELEALSKVLRQDQFEQFKAISLENLKQVEHDKAEEDKTQIQQVRYHQEILDFYANKIHPFYFEDDTLLFTLKLPEYRSKAEYLKAEYARFLDLSHKRAIINHFRYSSTFQPNTLEVLRLRSKVRHIEPDCNYFHHHVDEQTKAIANSLNEKLSYMPSLRADFYNNVHQLIFNFFEELNEKHFSQPVNFSYTKYEIAKERELKSWTMSIVLLDKGKYGLNSKW